MPKGIAKNLEHKANLLRERMKTHNPMFISDVVERVHSKRREKKNYGSSGTWKKDHVPWNKNLTKETDKRVAKGSLALTNREFKPETIQKIRIARSKQKFNKVSIAEVKFREKLKSAGVKFIPQYSIVGDGFITEVDIFVPIKNLCIYYDGDYWHNLPGYAERDKRISIGLMNLDYKVLRFWEHEIDSDISSVIKKILEVE